jgi:hypothetical protein
MNQEAPENGSTLRSLRGSQASRVSKYKLKRQWQKIAAEALAKLNDIKTNEINTSEHNITVFNEIFIKIQELRRLDPEREINQYALAQAVITKYNCSLCLPTDDSDYEYEPVIS